MIGTGILQHYPPANRKLQERIGREHLVLSQFFPGTAPTRHTFPMRNAVMSAGMSKYRVNRLTGIGRSTIDRILAAPAPCGTSIGPSGGRNDQ